MSAKSNWKLKAKQWCEPPDWIENWGQFTTRIISTYGRGCLQSDGTVHFDADGNVLVWERVKY